MSFKLRTGRTGKDMKTWMHNTMNAKVIIHGAIQTVKLQTSVNEFKDAVDVHSEGTMMKKRKKIKLQEKEDNDCEFEHVKKQFFRENHGQQFCRKC
ncbi:hypothetical protein R5R35_010222 [Gryllus longicercus]|uniref:Uncharacterized protein n=1 Tax=Gryllus longicercus TaxID=2509291 RepID=A0AAN9W091_9ORTH